jgi:hypothetical protein
MDISRHELDYFAQAYWHGFRFRFDEMIGLDRTRRLVHLSAKSTKTVASSRPCARSAMTR